MRLVQWRNGTVAACLPWIVLLPKRAGSSGLTAGPAVSKLSSGGFLIVLLLLEPPRIWMQLGTISMQLGTSIQTVKKLNDGSNNEKKN